MRVVFTYLLLLMAPALFAQTMLVHEPSTTLRLNLADLDSIQFGEESALLPLSIDFSVDQVGSVAEEGIWRIELAASLFDAGGAPLLDGIPVCFEVEAGDTLVTTENGTTGNVSVDDLSAPGIAYGGLLYPSRATNDTVTVTAVCEYAGEVFSTSADLRLPGQELTAVLGVGYDNYHFDVSPLPEHLYAQVFVWVSVLDGFGNPVKGVEVVFVPERGRIFVSQTLLPNVEPEFTGATNSEGLLQRFWLVRWLEVFPDPTIHTTLVDINANLTLHNGVTIESAHVTFYGGGGTTR